MSELQDYLATNPPLREAVVGYLVTDDEVWLGVRTRVSNDLGHLVVAGIGGGIERGESPENAFVRESLEEIEVRPTNYQKVGCVICLSPHRPEWNSRIIYFLVTGFEGDPKKTEDIDPHRYPKIALPLESMWPDNRVTVPLVLAGKRIVGSFLYGADGQIVEQDLWELAPDEPIPEKVCYTVGKQKRHV